jgi:hypothetical protein
MHGHGEDVIWHRFPWNKQGFDDARNFSVHGYKHLNGIQDTKDDESSESESESKSDDDDDDGDDGDDDDDDAQVVVLQTNWTKQLAASAAPGQIRLPQYAVIFGFDHEDPRNMYARYTLSGRPTTARCIMMALLALVQWCVRPENAGTRRQHDPYAAYEAKITPGLSPETRSIIIQTPCKSVESMFNVPVDPKRTLKGMPRTIAAHLRRLRRAPYDLDISFVTVEQTADRLDAS